MKFLKPLGLGFLAVLFGFLHFLPVAIFGVRPNFALAGIIAVLFFAENFWQGALFVSLASAVLKFSPRPSKEILIFFVLALAASFLLKKLPWQHFFSCLFLIITATLIFYLAVYPFAILSVSFAQELFYNLFFGAIIFWGLSLALKPSRKV